MSLFGTISFTARKVGGTNFGGLTFFGWVRFRRASVPSVVLIIGIPLGGGRAVASPHLAGPAILKT